MTPLSRRTGAGLAAILVAGTLSACGAERNAEDSSAPATVSATRASVRDDVEAAQSFATPAGVKLTTVAPAPSAADPADSRIAAPETKDNFISPGAPSDAQIAAELRELDGIQRQQRRELRQTSGTSSGGVTLKPDGTASVGPGVPEAVAKVVAGANAIAKFPYVYGGGHGSFVDTAYDCSGSLSYALAAGGLQKTTLVSGELAKEGEPGPGKWITIYANGGHTFMVVGGLRFDTSGRNGPLGSRWQTGVRSTKGFVVRHPPGL